MGGMKDKGEWVRVSLFTYVLGQVWSLPMSAQSQ